MGRRCWATTLALLAILCLLGAMFAACESAGRRTNDRRTGDDDTDSPGPGGACALIAHNDGTATDPCTGHIWQVTPPNGAMDWADALTYCNNLLLGGYAGWSLPDIDALRSLVRGCGNAQTSGACGVTDACLNQSCGDACAACGSSAAPTGGCFWPTLVDGAGACDTYWSSNPVADESGYAWQVDFVNGDAGGHDAVSTTHRVRCVL